MVNYSGYTAYRPISPMLWLGLFTVPWLSVWFLLREGHSPRSRLIGFGLMGVAVAVAAFSPKSEVTPEAPVIVAATEQKTLSAEEIEAAKQEKISQAYRLLATAHLQDGESVETFNARVTGLYKTWVAAQRDYRGEDWEYEYSQSGISEAYLDCRARMSNLGISDGGMFDLSNFNTPADAACRQRGYSMRPRVPQLSDYLLPMPTKAVIAEAEPVLENEETEEPVPSTEEATTEIPEQEG